MAKEWNWSYSKKKNYDVCPKRHYEVDIAKHFQEDSEQLTWGNEVHKSLAAAALHAKSIRHSGSGRDMVQAAALPETMASYQRWIDLIKNAPGTLLVERKYAITKDFQATSWFADNVWYRGICDLLMVNGSVATAIDWKTGKVAHDSIQLMLMATCIFIHHPEINTVKTRFIWLKEDCTTPEVFHRSEIMKEWTPILPQIEAMKVASLKMDFPPKPNNYCRRYCPVTSCPFHGKQHNDRS
jgi:hypothetical protein